MSLYDEMNYIDGITIIDKKGTILFTVKFNPDIDQKMEESIVGKNLFDVFYNINKSNSSLIECMEKDKLIEKKGQYVRNLYMDDSYTDNISIPIKHCGLIVGAIELSKVINENGSDISEFESNYIKDNSSNPVMSFKPKCLDMGYTARYSLNDIICKDRKMIKLIEYADHVAKSNSPIFITGETGTGKELFANGIHNASNRKDKPFIAQNCSAVPENLLESIFFGTSKGSYTGAMDRKGLFEACDGGTLFLDELHCMPLHLQAKLLRAIESNSARRIGENNERKFDVRIIAATNIKHDDILSKGYIREDLYYRLSVVKIDIPPLRERLEDIKILSQHFIKKYNKIFEKNIKSVSPDVSRFLLTYSWKGNIRELENFIESAVLNVSDEKIVLDGNEVKEVNNTFSNNLEKTKSLKNILEDTELNLLQEALLITKGNVSKAAEYLEIPRQTLQQKMIKYKININPKMKMPH